jgi:hypothetical protein
LRVCRERKQEEKADQQILHLSMGNNIADSVNDCASANGAECNSPAQRAGSLREYATQR